VNGSPRSDEAHQQSLQRKHSGNIREMVLNSSILEILDLPLVENPASLAGKEL